MHFPHSFNHRKSRLHALCLCTMNLWLVFSKSIKNQYRALLAGENFVNINTQSKRMAMIVWQNVYYCIYCLSSCFCVTFPNSPFSFSLLLYLLQFPLATWLLLGYFSYCFVLLFWKQRSLSIVAFVLALIIIFPVIVKFIVIAATLLLLRFTK